MTTHRRSILTLGVFALLTITGIACNSSKSGEGTPSSDAEPSASKPAPVATVRTPQALELLRKGSSKPALEALKTEPNINAQDANGATFLSCALGMGEVEAVQAALDKGAKLDVQDSMKATPFLAAIRKGDGLQADKNPKFEAYTVHESTSSIQKSNFPGANGTPEVTTAPSAASRKAGKEAFFKALKIALSKGADINAVDVKGRNALYYAAGDPELFAFLLEQGAKFPATEVSRETSIFANAVQTGFKEPVAAVLNHIAQATPTDKSLMLATAIRARRPELVKLLIEKGCVVEKAELAVAAGVDAHYTEGLALLQSAKVPIKVKSLQESLSAASHFGALSDCEEALKQGVSPNFIDLRGMTPLTWAVTAGDEKMIAILMKYHPDINFADGKGRTPVELAKKRKSQHVLQMLQGESR